MRHPVLAYLAAVFAAGPAAAQAPALSGIFPPGGRAGTSIESRLIGTNLAEVRSIHVSGAGVKCEPAGTGSATECPVRFSIGPEAEVGVREVRVVTNRGASTAGRIWVGLYPDDREKEPNDARSTAQPAASFPITISGSADKATDVDHYAFSAGAGETWVFAINAARHYSALDAHLGLLDPQGRPLTYAMDTFGRDPRIIYTFKRSGRYVLSVRDSMYRGGAGYTYRISMGRLPLVTRYSPMGGQRGTSINVRLKGVNLGGLTAMQVALPADGRQERVRVVPQTPAGPAEPIELAVTEAPQSVEPEPNDVLQQAARVPAVPWNVAGCINRRADRDVFAFAAREKQPLVIDVLARRLGSRLDGVLRILDASGKELAANDDAAGRDPRLAFTPPASGEYFAEVRSLSGHGGDDYFYRLAASAPPPADFALSVTPDNPTAPAGAAIPLTVTVRRSGYSGEIALRVEGLPPGAAADPPLLKPGQDTVIFTLSSAEGAAPAAAVIRVIGTAKIGDRVVERTAVGQERYQPPLANAQQTRMRDVSFLIAGVGPEAPYRLSVGAAPLAVKAGGKLDVTVKALRKAEHKDDIVVTVLGLPTGVKASALTIKAGQAEGKLTLTAAATAAAGPTPIIVQGVAKGITLAIPSQPLNVQPAK